MKWLSPNDWYTARMKAKDERGYIKWWAWYPVHIDKHWYWLTKVYRAYSWQTNFGLYSIPKYEYDLPKPNNDFKHEDDE